MRTLPFSFAPAKIPNYYATRNTLKDDPQEFTVDEFGWKCKLGWEGELKEGKFLLWVNGTLANEMPLAPPL